MRELEASVPPVFQQVIDIDVPHLQIIVPVENAS